MKIMTQNNDSTEACFIAEFGSTHFSILAQLRQKVLDTLANADAKMSELGAALLIELRIERHLHQLNLRRERAEQAKQPKAKRSRVEKQPEVTPEAPVVDSQSVEQAAQDPKRPDSQPIAPSAISGEQDTEPTIPHATLQFPQDYPEASTTARHRAKGMGL